MMSGSTSTQYGSDWASHVHYYEGMTSFDDGHVHYYSGWTSPPVMLPDGRHYHEFSGQTTLNDRHIHDYRGRTGEI